MVSTLLLATLASAPLSSEVTIYNQNFALIKEQRNLDLKAGIQDVLIEDVAQTIERESVGLKSLTAPGSISVLEQNYRFDLINADEILNRSVGQEVTLTRHLPNGSREETKGVLLAPPTAIVDGEEGQERVYNGLVLKTADGRVLINPSGEIAVSRMPEGMVSRPSLVWKLNSAKAGTNKIELSYLAGGMSWSANYVLSLDGAGKVGDLKGWVSLVNGSGIAFKDAKLKLLAGEVNRETKYRWSSAPASRAPRDMSGFAMETMKQEQFSEYHLYTSPRPVTIANKEAKQVSLLEGSGVPIAKKIILDATGGRGRWRSSDEGTVGSGPIKPLVKIEFKNNEASRLGMPLPAGTIKVFQKDSSGSLQMLGEAAIDHTPKEEKISLAVGRAFDIVGERKRTAFSWLTKKKPRDGSRETFEIEVRNRKDSAETVHVIERAWGQWAITKASSKHEKLDANTFQWVLTLKPKEVRKVTYTVETVW